MASYMCNLLCWATGCGGLNDLISRGLWGSHDLIAPVMTLLSEGALHIVSKQLDHGS